MSTQVEKMRRIAERNPEWVVVSPHRLRHTSGANVYEAEQTAFGSTWHALDPSGLVLRSRASRRTIRSFRSPGAAIRAMGFQIKEG